MPEKNFAITPLGIFAPYPPKGGNCPGYLLKISEKFYLLDCGNGSISQLQKFIPIEWLDAVFISHHHSDHVADLGALRHAWKDLNRFGNVKHPLPVFTPPEPMDVIAKLREKESFDLNFLKEGKDLDWDQVTVSVMRTAHHMQCMALRFEYQGKRFIYSGDTQFYPGAEQLIEFAKGADFFLLEGGYPDFQKKIIDPDCRHLSAGEAVELAEKANAKQLLITHLHPLSKKDEFSHDLASDVTRAALAQEGTTYLI